MISTTRSLAVIIVAAALLRAEVLADGVPRPREATEPPKILIDPKTLTDEQRRSTLKTVGPTNLPPPFNASWQQPNRCGPNALYVLMRLEGIAAPYDAVLAQFRIDENRGVSLAELSRVADLFHLRHDIIKVSDAELLSLTPPFIVHEMVRVQRGATSEEQGHFFVVNKIDAGSKSIKNLDIIDGVSGYLEQISPERFARSFSGYVLLPEHKSSGSAVLFAGWLFLYLIAAICLFLLGIVCFRHLGHSGGVR